MQFLCRSWMFRLWTRESGLWILQSLMKPWYYLGGSVICNMILCTTFSYFSRFSQVRLLPFKEELWGMLVLRLFYNYKPDAIPVTLTTVWKHKYNMILQFARMKNIGGTYGCDFRGTKQILIIIFLITERTWYNAVLFSSVVFTCRQCGTFCLCDERICILCADEDVKRYVAVRLASSQY